MEEQEFTSLGSYVESIKPIIDSEYSFLEANSWLDKEKLEEKEAFYKIEQDIVSNAVKHISNMLQYKKEETKLFKKWYTELLKFFTLHKKRADKFLKVDSDLPDGEVDAMTLGLLTFRRTVSAELAKMSIVINKSKASSIEADSRLPRIKNDIPIPIFFKGVMEKSFPVLKEILEKKKAEYWKKSEESKK